jgi:hypothetical protein
MRRFKSVSLWKRPPALLERNMATTNRSRIRVATLGWVHTAPRNPKVLLPGLTAPGIVPAVLRIGEVVLLGAAGGASLLLLPLCHASATGSLPLGNPQSIGDISLLPAFLV